MISKLLKKLFKICDADTESCGCSRVRGFCHICNEVENIRYCERCKHWFCVDCEIKYVTRAFNATLELLRGRKEGCCGPEGCA